jgi:hypothetical protein
MNNSTSSGQLDVLMVPVDASDGNKHVELAFMQYAKWSSKMSRAIELLAPLHELF